MNQLNWRGVALMATVAGSLVVLSIITPGVGLGAELLAWSGAMFSGGTAAASARRLGRQRAT